MPASLASEVQRRIERFYGLSDLPGIDDYARAAAPGERETVLVREDASGDVELAVILPPEGLRPPAPLSLDVLCQVVEGVSHFVHLAERIRTGTPTRQLELELQAEVDKFVLLGLAAHTRGDVAESRHLHARLYENVAFLHDASSEEGERYRVANDLAARLWVRLGARDARSRRGGAAATLRAFYRGGLGDKIRLARAALATIPAWTKTPGATKRSSRRRRWRRSSASRRRS